ncbi:hypothetical protein SAMN02745148_02168 [Modicisalibacter ilicicola DSM 19980]|uniref:DUF192 domain-containing protein n=1 Tax=Modicisalibacter ilicicola DSM 19980 TaxID=1121942 RepID=A0A1M5A3K2_9GAMM|nr:DUF192 domain-containing protein [Halomonas ilicicola]SHF24785.1 hypothetical protein SAMN02745148_02168 [Halomonas ilicicola DSM 19980]
MHDVKGRLLACVVSTAWLVVASLAVAAPALERGRVLVHGDDQTYRLDVEIARTPSARSFGLMERDHLPRDAGMLFVYPREQPPGSGFWMYRTRIPLDIAFLSEDGEIRAIHAMPPCPGERPSNCPSYAAGVPFSAALEVNRGYFAERGVEVGDRLTLPRKVASTH